MDRRNLRASGRVVDAVASEAGADPLELPPLYETVDPDALDALVPTLDDGVVRFEYADHAVAVDGDGAVRVVDRPVGGPAGGDGADPTTPADE